MRRSGSKPKGSAGLQPMRDAGFLLLLTLLLGSVRFEAGEGIRIPSLEKLAGTLEVPATSVLEEAPEEAIPARLGPNRPSEGPGPTRSAIPSPRDRSRREPAAWSIVVVGPGAAAGVPRDEAPAGARLQMRVRSGACNDPASTS